MSDLSGVHRTGLHVRDLARSVAFYRDLLGLHLLAEPGSAGAIHPRLVTVSR